LQRWAPNASRISLANWLWHELLSMKVDEFGAGCEQGANLAAPPTLYLRFAIPTDAGRFSQAAHVVAVALFDARWV
jgi:hypothetical protein